MSQKTRDYFNLFPGSSPLELITSYTALIGRLPPLPQWVGQGAVLGLQGGTQSVLNTLETGRETVGEPERRGGGVASRLDWTAELQRSQRAASRGTVVELGGVVSLGYCSLIIHLTH